MCCHWFLLLLAVAHLFRSFVCYCFSLFMWLREHNMKLCMCVKDIFAEVVVSFDNNIVHLNIMALNIALLRWSSVALRCVCWNVAWIISLCDLYREKKKEKLMRKNTQSSLSLKLTYTAMNRDGKTCYSKLLSCIFTQEM